jgi:hypothetical protein
MSETPDRDAALTRDELLELAAADALGALDEVESARFERGFASAVPSLQSELRSVQDRVAASPSLLSSEQPPASLRLRVLARVASAIEEQGAAPIATIGPARVSSSTTRVSDRDAIVQELIERARLERRPTQHLWRMVALIALAALVVSLYFQGQQRVISDRLMDYVDGRMTEETVRELARATQSFNFESARELQVIDSDGRVSKVVHAYIDESTRRVCVVGFGVVEPGLGVRVLAGALADGRPLAAAVVENRGFGVVFDAESIGDARELRLEIGDSAMRILI